MSTQGSNVTGLKADNLRTFFFSQIEENPATTNASNPFGNTVQIYYPQPQEFVNSRMALAQLTLWRSWYNITAFRQNNTFSYQWPVGAGYVNYNVILEDGAYDDINELQTVFEQIMIANGTYLIYTNPETDEVTNEFYLIMGPGIPKYAYSITANPVPISTALPTGYTTPPNWPGDTTGTLKDPTLTIPATIFTSSSSTPGFYSFSKILGFDPGTYPAPGTTIPYFKTGMAPAIESTNSVLVSCNMVNQGSINLNPQVFFSFAANTIAFGEQLVIIPPYPVYVPIQSQNYNYFQIQFFDDNNVLLQMQDAHVSGSVIFQG